MTNSTLIEDRVIGKKILYGIHHPSRKTAVRLFIVADGNLTDVTEYVAKIIKTKMIERRKYTDIPMAGSNPVHKAAEILAHATGKTKQRYKDLY